MHSERGREPQPRWAGFRREARGGWGAVGPLASSALPAVVTHPVPGPHVPRGPPLAELVPSHRTQIGI